MEKTLVILGPTATGKTDIALNLAKKINGELISCDSRQVYRGLDIGTGKLPLNQAQGEQIKKGNGFWEINGLKVWMYDVVSPKKQYTVADFVKDSSRVVEDIIKRDKFPIVVGGTGLYQKALLEGLSNLSIPISQSLRGEFGKLSLEELQKKLQMLSPTKWKEMNNSDRNNKRRLLRYIEIAIMNPYMKKSQKLKARLPDGQVKNQKYNVLKIGLSAPRPFLYENIDLRVISRVNQGMIEEVKELHRRGLSYKRMKELGLEYGVLVDYLTGKITKIQLIDKLKTKIHQYAKRQLTWFNREKSIVWFDISKKDYMKKVEKQVLGWYNESHVSKKS